MNAAAGRQDVGIDSTARQETRLSNMDLESLQDTNVTLNV